MFFSILSSREADILLVSSPDIPCMHAGGHGDVTLCVFVIIDTISVEPLRLFFAYQRVNYHKNAQCYVPMAPRMHTRDIRTTD